MVLATTTSAVRSKDSEAKNPSPKARGPTQQETQQIPKSSQNKNAKD